MDRALRLLTIAALVTACGGDGGDSPSTARPAALTATCADDTTPEDAWRCDTREVVECDCAAEAPEATLYVEHAACDPDALVVDAPDACTPGTYTIEVQSEGEPVCEATLEVVDTTPPVVRTRPVELWPPNHKLHAVTPADCAEVVDACDANVRLTFTWVYADEPANAQGDGNTEPDIVDAGCGSVMLRAERQGGGDGRVYQLGVRAEDDAGNVSDDVCVVYVPHDQGGDDDAPAPAPPADDQRDAVACDDAAE